MSKDNKILLIFPPVWLPDVPFLSTPTLTAYLKQKGINVEQIDLNIDFWRYLYCSAFIIRLHRKIRIKFEQLQGKGQLSFSELNMFKKIAIVGKIPRKQFVEEVQQRVISDEIFLDLVGLFSEFKINESIKKNLVAILNEDNHDYHDFFYNRISFSIFSYSIADLQNIVNHKSNPYTKYYSRYVISSIIATKSKIVGISITANNQVVPAFTLARTLKKNSPDCVIVIGGSWCSLIDKDLGFKLQLFPYIDYMIVKEGEKPLLDLVNTIFSGLKITDIKGVYFKQGDTVRFNTTSDNVNMLELPTPDFDGLILANYIKKSTLPIQVARGCYWGKCIFCSYPVLEPNYKQRRVEIVINDIIHLQNIYKTKVFSFVDSLISPVFADNFCKKIIVKKLSFEWVMFARFENQFTENLLKRMRECGCTTICWGLESGNQRILNEIKKNINLSSVQEILKNAADVGIHNRVLVMYGLPTEQLHEAYDTIDFVKNNIDNIHSLAYNFYHPEKNTPIEIYSKQKRFPLLEFPENDLSLGYEWKGQLNMESIEKLTHDYNILNNMIEKKCNNDFDTNQLINIFTDKCLIETEIPFAEINLSSLSVLKEKPDGSVKRYFFETQNF